MKLMSINATKSLCTWCVPLPNTSRSARFLLYLNYECRDFALFLVKGFRPILPCWVVRESTEMLQSVQKEPVMQDDGSEATAFAYVWQAKYRNMLEEAPWEFENFMKTDFAAYWREEIEEEFEA